jgi:hypothetical protein
MVQITHKLHSLTILAFDINWTSNPITLVPWFSHENTPTQKISLLNNIEHFYL